MKEFKIIKRLGTNSNKWDTFYDEARGDDFISLTVADSDYQGPKCIKKSIIEVVEKDVLGYHYLNDEYYETIISWCKHHYGYRLEKEWIIPSLGVVTSLAHIIRGVATKTKKVVLQPPVYTPFFDVVNLNDCEVVENRLVYEQGAYKINFIELEDIFKNGVDCLLICNPHNPVGRVWTKEEMQTMEILCKKYNVVLISDEIHSDIIMPKISFTSAFSFIEEYDDIIVCHAPSKSFNVAGLEVSNIYVADDDLRMRIRAELAKNFIKKGNVLGISAMLAAYKNGDAWLEEQNKLIYQNYVFLRHFFNTFIERAIVVKLEGTYLAWVDLSYLGYSSQEIGEKLRAYNVSVIPGYVYKEEQNCFIRLNLATSQEILKKGLLKIEMCVKKLEEELDDEI